jgi:putative spermidine/putrescine transport system substrate-binding protein
MMRATDKRTNREEIMFSRRTFVAAAGLAPFIITAKSKAASFEGQTLRVQSWGGSDGLVIQKYIVDPFMKVTGAKVIVEEGVTSASIAKVVAQKTIRRSTFPSSMMSGFSL